MSTRKPSRTRVRHSSDANPTHVYQKAGDYVATLHATDSKGIKGETEIDITASEEE
jgi:PKD repeat protein